MNECGATNLNRRTWLETAACGFAQLAFAGLVSDADERQRIATKDPLAVKPTMFPARARRIIFLFMHGGPSHVDTFDFKPELQKRDGQTATFHYTRFGKTEDRTVMGSPWSFRRYGQSGKYVSSLFPRLSAHVDDLCFIHSVHTNGTAHGQATLFMHTGSTNLVRPSMGSWISYGLGSQCRDLPGFVTICPSANIGGTRVHSSAFLPSAHQATVLGRAERPATEARFRNISSNLISPNTRRRQFELLQQLNQHQIDGSVEHDALRATVNSFEMAFRMQNRASQVSNLEAESAQTLSLYGIGQPETDDFGRQCLLARRLSEAGVRFVQVNFTDNSTTPKWDQHRDLKKDHERNAHAVDQPIAALLQDLKQRGLLEDTLVWWGGEFGRTPYSENDNGRDHNPFGFTMWLAGGGVKAGTVYGATDELGLRSVHDRVHTHDLHATILHLMGIDHKRLTYQYAGRDFRLTDVAGEVIQEVIA